MGVLNPQGKRIRGGNDSMLRDEIDQKKRFASAALLQKSGVGTMFAKSQLTPMQMQVVRELGLAGSDEEAIVKVALQFAFSELRAFGWFLDKQQATPPHKRGFRVVR